jgi:hypothetical protein
MLFILSVTYAQRNIAFYGECHHVECRYTECRGPNLGFVQTTV